MPNKNTHTPVEKSGSQVEEHEARREDGAPPEVLGALPLERGLRHKDQGTNNGHDEAHAVRPGVQHLPIIVFSLSRKRV